MLSLLVPHGQAGKPRVRNVAGPRNAFLLAYNSNMDRAGLQVFERSGACPLCAEFETGSTPAAWQPNLVGRYQLWTGSAVVIAALTPLRAGHVMVLPARHVQSFAAAGSAERDAALAVAARLAGAQWMNSEELLAFEHGVAPGKAEGCGISHAHIHLVPVTKSECAAMLNAAAAEDGTQSPADWASLRGQSYLRVWSVTTGDAICLTGPFSSQTLRRIAAQVLRSEHNDWRRHGNWSAMRTTDLALARLTGAAYAA